MVSDNHIIEIDEPDTDDKDLIKITLDKRNVELPIAYDHTIATRYNYIYTQQDCTLWIAFVMGVKWWIIHNRVH